MAALQRVEEDIGLRERSLRVLGLAAKDHAVGLQHGARPHRDRVIGIAPDQNADIADQAVDDVEKTRMHLHEIDGAEIGDGRRPALHG